MIANSVRNISRFTTSSISRPLTVNLSRHFSSSLLSKRGDPAEESPNRVVYSNLSNVAIGERKLITPEHEMFMDTCKKFFEKEVVPYHDEWERQGN